MQIAAVGDICPGDHYFTVGHGIKANFESGELRAAVSTISPYFSGCDIVFGNLEGVLSHTSEKTDEIESTVFRGPPDFAMMLRDVGFTHLSVANNHIMQHGVEAALESIDAIVRAGITPVGIRDRTGRFLCEPIFFNHHDKSFCLIAYSIIPETYVPKQKLYAYAANKGDIVRDVTALRNVADYIIVSVHGGAEGRLGIDTAIKECFDAIANAGASIILGHHTHTVLPFSYGMSSAIFYGLGNFIFDMGWDRKYLETAIAKIVISDEFKKIKVEKLSFVIENYRYVPRIKEVYSLVRPLLDRNNTVYSVVESVKKITFFFRHIHLGSSRTKLKFLGRKMTDRLR